MKLLRETSVMKKLIWYMTTIVFAVTLAFMGTSSAGTFGSDDKKKTEAESSGPPAIETPAVTTDAEKALPEGKLITLSGKIDESNRFVSESGEAFDLSDSGRGMEVKALTGKKVEIKGTVMEEEGKKTVEVTEYTILEELT
jgi:hypothetical protein